MQHVPWAVAATPIRTRKTILLVAFADALNDSWSCSQVGISMNILLAGPNGVAGRCCFCSSFRTRGLCRVGIRRLSNQTEGMMDYAGRALVTFAVRHMMRRGSMRSGLPPFPFRSFRSRGWKDYLLSPKNIRRTAAGRQGNNDTISFKKFSQRAQNLPTPTPK